IVSSLAVACIVFGCVFTGALLGMFFRTLVPEKHLSSDTQDVVKLGIALIATMAALVLGLLVASAKSTYDTRRTQLLQVSADIILLDACWRTTGRRHRMRGSCSSGRWPRSSSSSGRRTAL